MIPRLELKHLRHESRQVVSSGVQLLFNIVSRNIEIFKFTNFYAFKNFKNSEILNVSAFNMVTFQMFVTLEKLLTFETCEACENVKGMKYSVCNVKHHQKISKLLSKIIFLFNFLAETYFGFPIN